MPNAISTKSGAWAITRSCTLSSPHCVFLPPTAVFTYAMPELPVASTMPACTCSGQLGMRGSKPIVPDEFPPVVIESP